MVNKFLRIRDVMSVTGLSRSQIYALVAQGRFPRQIALSARCRAWLESDVQEWVSERVAESRGKV